ncbi:MAG: phosphotransferase enzyme family protein [Acidimicrobiia bacterium]
MSGPQTNGAGAGAGSGSGSDVPEAQLQRRFDLGAWEGMHRIAGGKSAHHILTTDRGRFVLRRSYRAKEECAVAFEHELVAHLRRGGFPGPEFVPTVDGRPCAVIDGRLWRVSVLVEADPADGTNPAHVEAAGASLGRYHRLVETFRPAGRVPEAAFLPDALAERLAAVRTLVDDPVLSPGDRGYELLGALRGAVDEGAGAAARLGHLYDRMPMTLIHAGCRRGSVLFRGDRLAVVLDFDSSRYEAKAYDVAVAVHDFAKIYGDPGSDDFKVHLDPGVAGAFVSAYESEGGRLSSEELEAVPLLLVAKRLKRALGRYGRLLAGEPLSDNDLRKINLELARVRSLGAPGGVAEALAVRS